MDGGSEEEKGMEEVWEDEKKWVKRVKWCAKGFIGWKLGTH